MIHEADTTYQYARVVEFPDGERHLELNEGQAIHSVYRPARCSPTTTGTASWSTRSPGRRDAAAVGSPSSATAPARWSRAYGRYFPDTRDRRGRDRRGADRHRAPLLRPARPSGLHFHAADARPFLRATDARYDAIFVDAYRQPYIPFYLATQEFFELVRDRLEPDGVVLINVGLPRGSTALEKVLTATMGAALPHVVRDPIEDTNTILIGGRAPVSAGHVLDAADALPDDLRPLARAAAFRIEPGLRGGAVYTDDRAPVEWLVDRSIVQYAAGER